MDDNINYKISKKDVNFIIIFFIIIGIYTALEESGRNPIIYIFGFLSIVMPIIAFIINIKGSTKKCNKEIDGLVSPIIAEAIIDGKIDLKNLIMTSIIQFNISGNVEIIDNETIILINDRNLEDYERELLKLIFPKNVKQTTFTEINNLFMQSKEKTNKFINTLTNIRNSIASYLEANNIISSIWTKIIACMKSISMLIIINLPVLLIVDIESLGETIGGTYIIGNIIIFIFFACLFYGVNSFKELIILDKGNNKKSKMLLYWTLVFVPSIICIFILKKQNSEYFVQVLIILALNIVNVMFNKQKTLSIYGRKERKKLLELKNYINEYSLIKDRDLKSAVVWDEYLAYATAFGIPNKVTSKIYENWYNMNITLQFIKSIV